MLHMDVALSHLSSGVLREVKPSSAVVTALHRIETRCHFTHMLARFCTAFPYRFIKIWRQNSCCQREPLISLLVKVHVAPYLRFYLHLIVLPMFLWYMQEFIGH